MKLLAVTSRVVCPHIETSTGHTGPLSNLRTIMAACLRSMDYPGEFMRHGDGEWKDVCAVFHLPSTRNLTAG